MEKEKLFATQALRTERKQRGLTQQEFADLLSIKANRDVSLALYIKWEQGRRPVNTDMAIMISRELGQSIKTLFSKAERNINAGN